MINKNNFLIFSTCLLFANAASATSQNKCENQSLSTAKNLINQLSNTTPAVNATLQGRNIHSFSDIELLALIQTISSHHNTTDLNPENALQIIHAENTLISLLRKFKVSGYSFCIDPNFAFIWDNQNPQFNVFYKNDNGDIKQRSYQASINSIGFKFEFAIKLNLIFFLNTDFNFYDSNKVIEFDYGIDLGIGATCFGLCLTYAPFKNMPGGFLMIGYPLLFFTINPLSFVTSGTLTPIR